MAVHTTTRGAIRAQVRQRADLVSSQVVTDDELNTWIVASLAELHGLLVKVDSEYLLTVQSIALTGASSYSLSGDFMAAKKVEFSLGNGRYLDVERTKLDDKNRYTDPYSTLPMMPQQGQPVAYFIAAGLIYFLPESSTGTVRVWYYPSAPQPADDVATFDVINGLDEYVIADVCLKIAFKLGAEQGSWKAIKADLRERVAEEARERDMGGTWGMTILPRGGR